ncbi:lytic transglycosylase domain-containing protein [Burkholderia gladioli]|uniref:lytic transglycosylase domain-containing protein n=1 Tax=Burkholderia gladioli TaxID=28095 RepID=UPI003D1BFE50
MATPFSVLPQYQGNLYQLQRQQQLAQALTQGALQGQQLPATVGSGQYQVAPRASIGAGISQLGQALLASRLGNQAGQGLGQLGAQQWAALTGQGLGATSSANAGGFGTSAGAQSPLQSAPAGQSGVGTDAAAGADGATDNLGASAQQPQGMLSPGGPMNPIGMPVQQAAMMYLSNPDKYWEAQAGAYKPTDTSLMLRQAGIDPTSALGRQIMQQAIAKQNYIAPTSLRPGGYAVYADGREEQLPQIPEGFTAQRGPNGWQVVPVQGGAAAMSASAAAKAGGQAQYKLKEVWDPTANNGQGGFVQQSVANVANAANGVPGFSPFQNATRQVESGGRADAVNPASGAAGSMQVTPTGAGSANPGFGVRPAANNSPAELQRVGADYAAAMQQRYGNDADAAVAYNWGAREC